MRRNLKFEFEISRLRIVGYVDGKSKELTLFGESNSVTLRKVCITGMAAANAVGDKIPMFVIGKAQKPSCYKNIKFLPC